MKIEMERKERCTLVAVSGRLDVTSAKDFQETCVQLADKGDTNMVVDLAGLEYISSAGLRAILFLAKTLKDKGGELRFCGLAGMIEDVFRVSGFHTMFTIAPTFEELPEG